MTHTRQEMFDKACSALIQQGEKSARHNGSNICLYRGPNGLKCAIGHLIPDDKYDSNWDRDSVAVGSNLEGGPILRIAAGIVDADVVFARALQRAHDRAHQGIDFVDDFKRRARRLATTYQLNTEVLN